MPATMTKERKYRIEQSLLQVQRGQPQPFVRRGR
jgi:hypothetical protein